MTSHSETPTRASRTLLWYSVVLAVILYLDRVCISQSQADISAELGLTKQQMGIVMMMFSLAYAIFEVPGGLARRPDRPARGADAHRGLVVGLHDGHRTGGGVLVADGESGSCSASAKPAPFPNLTKAFGNWFTGEDRTRAQSIMWLAARWGGAFTPLIVVVTLDFMTWRHSFFLFGAVGFVWAGFFYRWFRNTPAEHPGVNQAERAQLASPDEASAGGHGHVNPPVDARSSRAARSGCCRCSTRV